MTWNHVLKNNSKCTWRIIERHVTICSCSYDVCKSATICCICARRLLTTNIRLRKETPKCQCKVLHIASINLPYDVKPCFEKQFQVHVANHWTACSPFFWWKTSSDRWLKKGAPKCSCLLLHTASIKREAHFDIWREALFWKTTQKARGEVLNDI